MSTTSNARARDWILPVGVNELHFQRLHGKEKLTFSPDFEKVRFMSAVVHSIPVAEASQIIPGHRPTPAVVVPIWTKEIALRGLSASLREAVKTDPKATPLLVACEAALAKERARRRR